MPESQEANSPRPRGKIIAVGIVLLLIAGTLLFFFLREQRRFAPSTWGKGQRVILQLCGSNTMGAELAPALVRGFLQQQGADGVELHAGTRAEEMDVQGKLAGHSIPSVIQIQAHGSATAFIGLADRGCDIGMASRKIKPDEALRLASLGDMVSPASEHLLASGRIAVIVNRSNPITSIDKERLAQIFEGKIANWGAAGSRGSRAIHLYAPSDNSGTWETFKGVVLDGGELGPSTSRFEGSAALSAAVAADPDGIGFVGQSFAGNAKPLSLTPDADVLSRRLYLYTPENPKNIYTRKFVDFALSSAGQRIVRAKGFATVSTATEGTPPTAGH